MSHEFDESGLAHERDESAAITAAFAIVEQEVFLDVTLPGRSILGQIHEEHPEIEERPYQVDCLSALQRTRDEGRQIALVQMATGLGKTTVVAVDAMRFLESKPGGRVLFLCHQNEILRQAKNRFEKIMGNGGQRTFGTFNGVTKKGADATCVFASFQTMKTRKEEFAPDEFDYIVVDESHHSKADTYEPTLKYFQPDFMLGVTATPDRKDLKEIRDIFGKEIYSKSLAEALGEGLLARPDYRVILDDIEDRLINEEDLSIAELNRTFFIPKRDEEIAKIIGERLESIDKPRTIVFCPSIEHSERMQALLENSKVINSRMNQRERAEILKGFRNGDISSVLTVDLFNEGIDIADANAIVFLRSTQSETIFLQQLGRGLRKTPGKEELLVLDFVANCDRLMMIEKLLQDAVRSRYGSSGSRGGDEGIDNRSIYDLDFSTIAADIATANDLNLGTFEFTESVRKITEIINRTRNTIEIDTSWSEERSIEYYKNFSRTLGRIAMIDDILGDVPNGGPGRSKLLASFNGSLRELREASELAWDEKNATAYYKDLSERLGHPATKQEIADQRDIGGPSYSALVTPFGRSFPRLKLAAGYEPTGKEGPRFKWDDLTEEQAVQHYRNFSEEIGHAATIKELSDAARIGKTPSFIVMGKFFDESIDVLRAKAGYEVTERKDWSDLSREDAITYYAELSTEIGKPASVADMNARSKSLRGPSVPALLKHFDGKSEALRMAAGFPAKRQLPSDWPPERCIEYIREITEELGRAPTFEDIRERCKAKKGPNINLLVRDFGGLTALKKAALRE